MAAIRGVERCDVAILLIDALEGVTAQDARIGGLIHERGRGCLVVVNKWDLVKGGSDRREFEGRVRERLYFLDYAPVFFISALTGEGVEEILPAVDAVARDMERRVPTPLLNRIVKGMSLPAYRGKPLKVYYITQVGTGPPTFVAFVNHPEGVKEAYRRYMVNTLRRELGLDRVPLRLLVRKSK